MKYRRPITFLLALCILLSVLPIPILAATMTASDSLIQFIKDNEGFSKYPQWDYQQYSVGYGSGCEAGEYPDGITEEEADALLRKHLAIAESAVNAFVERNQLTPTQQQYDFMLTLTYGLGTEWMRDIYTLPKRIINGATELAMLNTLGDWVSAGGQTLDGLIYRRMRENYIYFYGEYRKTDSIAEDVPYACLKFDAAGGSVAYKRLYTFRGSAYGLEVALPTPSRSGYEFLGWYDSAGRQITNDTIAENVLMTVYAKWQESEKIYKDVSASDWFYTDVKRATELELFAGYPDGSFQPNGTMTRGMFAQVLYRIAGTPACSDEIPFTDVSEAAWYYDAVRWAYAQGVVNGVSTTSFAPEEKITREQMATMLFKYYDVDNDIDTSQYHTLDAFIDENELSEYALLPMQWAVGVGLINGMGADRLAPRSDATRAQAAAILVRLTGILPKGVA